MPFWHESNRREHKNSCFVYTLTERIYMYTTIFVLRQRRSVASPLAHGTRKNAILNIDAGRKKVACAHTHSTNAVFCIENIACLRSPSDCRSGAWLQSHILATTVRPETLECMHRKHRTLSELVINLMMTRNMYFGPYFSWGINQIYQSCYQPNYFFLDQFHS